MPTYVVLQVMKPSAEEIDVERERLIEAPTKAAAIRMVADETITAELAETADIVRLAKAGVELETVE
jgi:hypothetical protein